VLHHCVVQQYLLLITLSGHAQWLMDRMLWRRGRTYRLEMKALAIGGAENLRRLPQNSILPHKHRRYFLVDTNQVDLHLVSNWRRIKTLTDMGHTR